MDTLAIVAMVLVALGLLGSIIPALPGPVFSFAGLVALSFSRNADGVRVAHLVVFGVLLVVLVVADYAAPALGARFAGSTRNGVIGAAVGTVAGLLFFPPLGMFLGALIGAVVGEYQVSGEFGQALKAGMGVVAGSVAAIFAQLLYATAAAVYFATRCNFG